jgi:hypothetical protein
MKNSLAFLKLWPVCIITLGLIGCGTSTAPVVVPPAPLKPANVNLIFVASEDLAYQAAGDIDPATANLTNQGLQRSFLLGKYLKAKVLGSQNVTSIYALEPMTHLQTVNHYPDMVALETVQQFAMLNQATVPSQTGAGVTGNSYPIFASYAAGPLPDNVAQPVFPCPGCQGLDFTDPNGVNESLIDSVVTANQPGFYVFSAPWEIISTLMREVNQSQNYGLSLPTTYRGPNFVYAITIASGGTHLVTYNANLNPSPTYPALSLSAYAGTCTASPFQITVTPGVSGAALPSGINTDETVYMIRHAEAHPATLWDDGNYLAAGQWRALLLPLALRNKVQPDQVYSVDPAIGIPAVPAEGSITSSYVRPAMTVEPFAIANRLPLNLAASVPVFAQNAPDLATYASDFFFTGGNFSNQTLLVAWEHKHIPPTLNALFASYQSSQSAPTWPDDDYDTIWRVRIDGQGNLTVDNTLCEGIKSSSLPATAPVF